MAFDEGLCAWVEEALEPVGTVTMRRMMGGATLYLDGVVFAIIVGDDLWLKSDAENDAAFEAAGCDRFSYDRKDGTTATMNYRRAPGDVHDDPDALRQWAALGIAAGQRAEAKKRPRKPKHSSPT